MIKNQELWDVSEGYIAFRACKRIIAYKYVNRANSSTSLSSCQTHIQNTKQRLNRIQLNETGSYYVWSISKKRSLIERLIL